MLRLGVFQACLDKALRNLVTINGLSRSLAQTPLRLLAPPRIPSPWSALPGSLQVAVQEAQLEPRAPAGLGARGCEDPPVPLPAIPKWLCSKAHPALPLFQHFGCPGNCTLGFQSERQLQCGRNVPLLDLWPVIVTAGPGALLQLASQISAPAAPPWAATALCLPWEQPGDTCQSSCHPGDLVVVPFGGCMSSSWFWLCFLWR